MEKIDELIILFDYYEKLLTESQRNYFIEYYFNNLSLSEISENFNVSRNAVSKDLKLTVEKLNGYEEKLKLYSAFQKRSKIYEKMKKIDNKQLQKLVNECIKTEIEGGQNE